MYGQLQKYFLKNIREQQILVNKYVSLIRMVDLDQFNRRDFVSITATGTLVGVAGCTSSTEGSEAEANFELEEATIEDIHTAYDSGALTTTELVESYISRIDEYDSELNSIIETNPDAQQRASELDDAFDDDSLTGPLHGIPVIVKDNYDTEDMPTTGGSEALSDSVPPEDSRMVKQIRDAGGIILAKANLHELAYARTSVSSVGGQVRNPYDTDKIPGGSSGGSAAATAANLGTVSIGTDTGCSIRDPATLCNVVGLRPTVGLTSRDGIIPFADSQDVGGPITRTVTDTARLLDVFAGYDPNDQMTAKSVGNIPDEGYVEVLDENALDGARLGILEEFFHDETEGEVAVSESVYSAISEMENEGAETVSLDDTSFFPYPSTRIWELEWQRELDMYLENLDEEVPNSTLELIESGEGLESVIAGLESAAEVDSESLMSNEEYLNDMFQMELMRRDILETMAEHDLDALVYPSRSRPAEEIGESLADPSTLPDGLASTTGFPGLTVPAEFAQGSPVGIEFFGRAFSEPTLLKLGYAYEQISDNRVPPDNYSDS